MQLLQLLRIFNGNGHDSQMIEQRHQPPLSLCGVWVLAGRSGTASKPCGAPLPAALRREIYRRLHRKAQRGIYLYTHIPGMPGVGISVGYRIKKIDTVYYLDLSNFFIYRTDRTCFALPGTPRVFYADTEQKRKNFDKSNIEMTQQHQVVALFIGIVSHSIVRHTDTICKDGSNGISAVLLRKSIPSSFK